MSRRTSIVAAITVAAIAAVAGLAAYSIESTYDANLASERSSLVASAQVTAEQMAAQMTGVEDIEHAALNVSSLSVAPGLGAPGSRDLPGVQAMLDHVQALRPEFEFAALSDSGGTNQAISPADPLVVGTNFAYRDWYRGVMRTGRPYVSTAYVSAVPGHPLVVAVATPIVAPAVGAGAPFGGRLLGILYIGYKIGSVQTFADRLSQLPDIDLQVTDQAGVVIAADGSFSGHLVSAANVPTVAAALAGRSTTTTTADAVTAGAPVPGLGWTISAGAAASETAATAQRATASSLAGGLLLVLAIAGGALVITTRRNERAGRLHAATAAELTTVHQSLTEAIQVFAPDGSLVTRNAAAERIYDLRRDDRTTDSITPRWELLSQDGSPLEIDDGPLAVARRTGQASERVVVGLRHRISRRVKWLSISTTPIRTEASGITGYVSCAGDITERMQTIRELNILSAASQRLSSTLVPEEVVRALTTAAAGLCSAPGEPPRRAQLFMIDGDMVILHGEHDPTGSVTFEGASFGVSEHPYLQRVITSQEPVVADLEYDEFGPTVADLMRRAEIRNCAWVPLVRDHQVVAVLAVSGRRHDLITEAQLERLKALANVGELALSNARAHQSAAGLARTDPLTGLANRRALDERIGQLPRTQFAVVAIDVDDLKVVNDRHGHVAGDLLLASIAGAMAAEMRPSDILARTGGDEFVALLVDCDATGAVEFARRLEQAVATVNLPSGAASVSVGSAAGAPGDDPAAVSREADAALYRSKSKHKGRRVGAVQRG